MTEQQFTVLANLLGLTEQDQITAHAIIFEGAEENTRAAPIVDRLRQADGIIRGAYVIHGPMEFRVVVGHRDTHRAPGAIRLRIGDIVRLTAQSTERWIPVRVTALPASPVDYYSGVILEQLAPASRYQTGNGVRFSEDQILTEAPRAASGTRRRQKRQGVAHAESG
ncbi:MAG: alpha/beta hydrolase [Candidimonas sp.]|jgi:hypothetical protein